jgi:hypothetical protein
MSGVITADSWSWRKKLIGILCFLIALGMGISSLSFASGALRTKGTAIDMVHSSRTNAPIVRGATHTQQPPYHTLLVTPRGLFRHTGYQHTPALKYP